MTARPLNDTQLPEHDAAFTRPGALTTASLILQLSNLGVFSEIAAHIDATGGVISTTDKACVEVLGCSARG